MKLTRYLAVLTLLFAVAALWSQAEELDGVGDALSELSETAGKAYISPVVHAFGADFNTGWFTRTPKAKLLGIDISFKLVLMSAMFDDADQTFETSGAFHLTEDMAGTLADQIDWTQYGEFGDVLREDLIDQLLAQDYDVGIAGPTIIGSNDDHVVITFYEQNFTVEAGDGAVLESITVDQRDLETAATGLLDEAPALTLYTPQFTFGTIQGTNVTVRFMPNYNIKDFGELDYWGVGVQHNPIVWLGPMLKFVIPVDLSLQVSTQQMTVGDIITASSWNFGLNVSKNIGFKLLNIEPYAGFMVEGAKLEFEYEYEYELVDEDSGELSTVEDKIKFDMESDNATRFIVGVAMRLGQLEINADYNISEVNSYSAGLGLGFTF